MAVVYRDKYNRRITKAEAEKTEGSKRASYSPTTGKNLSYEESKSRTDLRKTTPVEKRQASQPKQAFQLADPQANMSLDPMQNMSLDPMQNMSVEQQGGFYDSIKNRLLQDIYATTGFQVGGYTPPAETQFTNPVAIGLTPKTATGVVQGTKNAVSAVTKKTVVKEAAKVGVESGTAKATTTAGKIATNTATKKQTASWLSKLARTARNPQVVVGTLMAAIGSYPFAGFIKEEALQTISYGVKTALDNENIEGAEEALALQDEVLEPNLWDGIMSRIPYANVLNNLDKFYEAAKLKSDIDKRIVSDLKKKQEIGETEEQMYDRIAQERKDEKEQERLDDEAYYAMVREQQAAAKAAERAADEKYWADILAQQEARKQQQEEEENDYWVNYYKQLAEYYKESTPSKLNFGLL